MKVVEEQKKGCTNDLEQTKSKLEQVQGRLVQQINLNEKV